MSKAATTAVYCRQVSKRFGNTKAVHDVSIEIRLGTVHALVGENGAGKSTLLGMISGRIASDAGEIRIFGQQLHGGRPREARGLGLVAVYQELTMVPMMSAEANVFLGQTRTRSGILARKQMRRRFLELCEFFEAHIDPAAAAADLSVSQQQILEIMRGVESGARVLLLDEPTAALAERERDALYSVINRLRDQGTTIVIVSHNLDEVLSLSDDISVLRDGQLSRSAPRRDWDKQVLIRAMVGREVEVLAKRGKAAGSTSVLEAVDVRLPGVLHGIDLTVAAGEIVGLWGLVGAGRTTFLRSLAGLKPMSSGSLTLVGADTRWPRSPREAISRGIAMVPEDRKNGLVLNMDGASNVWLGRKVPRRVRLDRRRERRDSTPYAEFFGFKPSRLKDAVAELSGGNQQKVLLAKWAARNPRVFLIDEPTRGIDIAAKSEVLTSLVSLAEAGSAIVVTSSELEEVLAISHRLIVFVHGNAVASLDASDPKSKLPTLFVWDFVKRKWKYEQRQSRG